MAYLCHQPGDAIPGNRIMVIGKDVITVQRVSRYCLEGGAEVFPYYGVPTIEEVTLFDPEISVLCIPLPKSFLCNLNQRYILWSEQPILIDLPLVSTKRELENCLQLALH
jgi:hypothetical protein